jgi:hypothetical protein
MNWSSDTAILEDAKSFCNDAMSTIALQYRRLRIEEPEDSGFVFRYQADLEFLIIALRRLRRTAELAARVLFVEDVLRAAINNFDQALPDLVKMRNVGKHFDEYVLNNPRRRYRDVQGGDLLVNRWNGTQYEWLGRSLNIDIAHQAAEELFIAVKLAYDDYLKAYPPECS